MINLIMFNSGKLPEHIYYTFKQIRLFNPYINVYFLTDKNALNNKIFKEFDVKPINKDKFYSNKIKEFENCFNYSSNNFWTIAATRLIYIENFLRESKLNSVYHFENDVLLYYNLNKYHDIFKNNYQSIAITPGGHDKIMTGFMFIKNYNYLSNMTDFFIYLLKNYSFKNVINKYKMDMVNEMTLMKAYQKEKNNIENLPILPFGNHSKYFDMFNSIFDPASWGQFIGGTTKKIPGAKPKDHYIGLLLRKNKDWKIDWIKKNNKLMPFLNINEKLTKINNLHIHSKELYKYISL